MSGLLVDEVQEALAQHDEADGSCPLPLWAHVCIDAAEEWLATRRQQPWRLCTTHENAEPGDASGLTAAYRCGRASASGLFDCEWVSVAGVRFDSEVFA